jgi:hypothetical protein
MFMSLGIPLNMRVLHPDRKLFGGPVFTGTESKDISNAG